VPTTDPREPLRPGRLTYLSEADKAAICEAALEIIGTIGMRVHHEEARELLRAAGCTVTEPDLVKIPRELVERARESAPAMIEVFDRAGEPAMSLGGFREGKHSIDVQPNGDLLLSARNTWAAYDKPTVPVAVVLGRELGGAVDDDEVVEDPHFMRRAAEAFVRGDAPVVTAPTRCSSLS